MLAWIRRPPEPSFLLLGAFEKLEFISAFGLGFVVVVLTFLHYFSLLIHKLHLKCHSGEGRQVNESRGGSKKKKRNHGLAREVRGVLRGEVASIGLWLTSCPLRPLPIGSFGKAVLL